VSVICAAARYDDAELGRFTQQDPQVWKPTSTHATTRSATSTQAVTGALRVPHQPCRRVATDTASSRFSLQASRSCTGPCHHEPDLHGAFVPALWPPTLRLGCHQSDRKGARNGAGRTADWPGAQACRANRFACL
jgi:hypothetical protein